MTRHQVLWRAETGSADVLLNDGIAEPFVVSVTPVVTVNALGVRAGVLHRSHDAFGYWYSSQSTDPISAWRTARMLCRVSEMTVRTYGADNDISAILSVFERKLDAESKEFIRAAEVLRLTPGALTDEANRLIDEHPDGRTAYHLWHGMPEAVQDKHVELLRILIDQWPEDATDRQRQLLETIELRVRTKDAQIARENALIEAGLPETESLASFLESMHVTNLVHTDPGDFGPTHFWRSSTRTLDQEMLGLLIGEYGYASEVKLLTTPLQPDDPKAHQSLDAGFVRMYSHDFGEPTPPAVLVDEEALDLIAVRWDRVTERYLIKTRPSGLEYTVTSMDEWRPLVDLRASAKPLAPPPLVTVASVVNVDRWWRRFGLRR